ncbi:MAG: WD40 repeat domain-containing protein, partial [candidate division KSB1 bacterium]|nr:WD40 repeat domain-containing protein [candidate division KSB1 bacterium]
TASGERRTAQLLLRSLISEENTRLALPLKEISRRIQRSPMTVARILSLFVQSRLIREIQEEKPWRYELTHEYLIEKINQITGKVMTATQRANRLLRQYLSSYSLDNSTRLPLRTWWFVRRYADFKQSQHEQEFLRRSLYRGLLKSIASILLLAGGLALGSAWLSINEIWQEQLLNDGHLGPLRQMTFSPDGRLLISGGADHTIIVWDFARRERLATLADHETRINAMTFSPDGRWFATGDDSGRVIVWEAARLAKVAVLRGHRGAINSIGFAPHGRWLVTSASDESMLLWEVRRWTKVGEMPSTHHFHTANFRFTPNGEQLVDPFGKILDLATWQLFENEARPPFKGSRYAFSPDGNTVVSVCSRGMVYFSKMQGQGGTNRYPAHRFFGRAAAFSPNGRLVATGAEDIVLWDAEAQTILSRFEHTDNVWSLAFTPDSRWLVSGHGDGAILVWDIVERRRIASLNGHSAPIHTVAFSPDGKRLASAGKDRSIIVWDAQHGRKVAVLLGHSGHINDVVFSSDGQTIASTDMTTSFIVWDLPKRQPQFASASLSQDQAPLLEVIVSPDHRWVATPQGVYDAHTGEQVVDFLIAAKKVKQLQADENGNIGALAFSADGHRLVSMNWSGWIFLWNVHNWQLVEAFQSGKPGANNIKFSPDNKWLAFGDVNGGVWLIGLDPLRDVRLLGRHSSHLQSVAFSPDGRELATASDDQTICLWDVKRRRLITRLGTHTAPINTIAFSPDGRRLASGEHDKSVRLYTRHHTLWGQRLD